MILQQCLEDTVIFDHVFVREDLREVVQDVKCPDVELVHGEDGRVAAHDEGETPEVRNPVSNSDRKLSVEVLSAPGSTSVNTFTLNSSYHILNEFSPICIALVLIIDQTIPEVVGLLVGGYGGVHDGGGGKPDARLLRCDVDGLLVVVRGHRQVPLPHGATACPCYGLVIVQPPLVTSPPTLLNSSSEDLLSFKLKAIINILQMDIC